MKKISCVAPLLVCSAISHAIGFESAVSIEIQNDYVYKSDDESAEFNSLYATIEPEFILTFNDAVSMYSHFILEPVKDVDDDNYFEHEGLYLSELTLNYDTDKVGAVIGKYTQNFGIAWDIAPGVYGTELAEDYELAERIGLGGYVNFGEHTLTGDVFFLDTTFLSDSIISQRGRTRLEDGGVSNTEDLSSFVISLSAEEIASSAVGYQLSYEKQEGGEGDETDEKGYAISLFGAFDINDNMVFEPVAEYAKFSDFEGVENQDADYLTAAINLAFSNNWSTALTYAEKNVDAPDGTSSDTDIVSLNIGYAFENGIGVDFSIKQAEEDNVKSDGLGLLLSYEL